MEQVKFDCSDGIKSYLNKPELFVWMYWKTVYSFRGVMNQVYVVKEPFFFFLILKKNIFVMKREQKEMFKKNNR